MNMLFFAIWLFSLPVLLFFIVKMFISKAKKDETPKKKYKKFSMITLGVTVVSFFIFIVTADSVEEPAKVAVTSQEVEKDKVEKEPELTDEQKAEAKKKAEEEKVAAELKAKEEAKAKAKSEAKAKAKAEAKAKEDSIPREHKSALKKAETYADVMNMSKKGIYEQLTSEHGENFPPEAAQYAIDNVVVDWKENALKKAQTYAETMSMSDAAIYEQLISEFGEKFTAEEAKYAVDNLK